LIDAESETNFEKKRQEISTDLFGGVEDIFEEMDKN
jgi:hypothetical protein